MEEGGGADAQHHNIGGSDPNSIVDRFIKSKWQHIVYKRAHVHCAGVKIRRDFMRLKETMENREIPLLLAIIMFVAFPQLVTGAGIARGTFSIDAQESIAIEEITYLASDFAGIFIKNVGETESINIKSVYVDGRSYQLVTLEIMKEDNRWYIPPGESPGWRYINPGEAFLEENSISQGEVINITVRSLTPFIQGTTHEFQVITMSGTVASAKATALFVLKDIERVSNIIISYEDGTKMEIRPDSPYFSEIMDIITKDVFSSMDIVVKYDVDPYATKYVLVDSGYFYENQIVEERIYLLFDGPHAGKLLTYGSLCCVLTRARSSLWKMRNERAMNKLEEFITSIKSGQENANNKLPFIIIGIVAAIIAIILVVARVRSSKSRSHNQR